jgi:excisionase family DNA binding protein
MVAGGVRSMSAAIKSLPTPRYGSAAQLANYSGLSVKTVRRLVDAGKVRGIKVGRRLLIPFEDLDRHILRMDDHRPKTQEVPTMAIAPTTVSPHRSVDATGRALPMTEAEIRARAEAVIRALDEIADMTDETDTDEVWEQFTRGIDEDRLSDRKRFR